MTYPHYSTLFPFYILKFANEEWFKLIPCQVRLREEIGYPPLKSWHLKGAWESFYFLLIYWELVIFSNSCMSSLGLVIFIFLQWTCCLNLNCEQVFLHILDRSHGSHMPILSILYHNLLQKRLPFVGHLIHWGLGFHLLSLYPNAPY